MSIKAIGIVLESPISPPTNKLAAVVLADWCNDEGGSLHPSMAAIAKKVGISRSQAQRIVHGFIAEGLLSVTANAGGGKPGMTPKYQLHLDQIAALGGSTGRMDATGSADATGRMDAQDGSHGCTGGVAPMRQTGSTDATQTVINRQGTTKEPSSKKRASNPRANHVDLFPDVTPQVLSDFQAVRKAGRGGPITETVAKGIRREASKAGLTVQQALEMCCERGWKGFNASWVSVTGETAFQRGQRERAAALGGGLVTCHFSP